MGDRVALMLLAIAAVTLAAEVRSCFHSVTMRLSLKLNPRMLATAGPEPLRPSLSQHLNLSFKEAPNGLLMAIGWQTVEITFI